MHENDQNETNRSAPQAAAGAGMPRSVRLTVAGCVVVLVAGALYLAAVRGPAMLLDLSSMSSLFCL